MKEDIKATKQRQIEHVAGIVTEFEQNDPGPFSLLDRLKVKRANYAKESNAKLRKFDRMIELLERSDAEAIMRQAEEVAFQE
jgi:hypothetical protein